MIIPACLAALRLNRMCWTQIQLRPVDAVVLFDQDTRVTVQLHTTASSQCWSSELTTVAKTNTVEKFVAKMP